MVRPVASALPAVPWCAVVTGERETLAGDRQACAGVGGSGDGQGPGRGLHGSVHEQTPPSCASSFNFSFFIAQISPWLPLPGSCRL